MTLESLTDSWVEIKIYKRLILVQIALLWIGQPNNQKQSINQLGPERLYRFPRLFVNL